MSTSFNKTHSMHITHNHHMGWRLKSEELNTEHDQHAKSTLVPFFSSRFLSSERTSVIRAELDEAKLSVAIPTNFYHWYIIMYYASKKGRYWLLSRVNGWHMLCYIQLKRWLFFGVHTSFSGTSMLWCNALHVQPVAVVVVTNANKLYKNAFFSHIWTDKRCHKSNKEKKHMKHALSVPKKKQEETSTIGELLTEQDDGRKENWTPASIRTTGLNVVCPYYIFFFRFIRNIHKKRTLSTIVWYVLLIKWKTEQSTDILIR